MVILAVRLKSPGNIDIFISSLGIWVKKSPIQSLGFELTFPWVDKKSKWCYFAASILPHLVRISLCLRIVLFVSENLGAIVDVL